MALSAWRHLCRARATRRSVNRHRRYCARSSGVVMTGGAMLNDASQLTPHRVVTDAVHAQGGKIALQILHTGRYSYQPHLVAPSAIQAPINRFMPHELTHDEILQLIDDFAHCAQLAREAGYDGVEVMGSEGLSD